MDLVERLRLLSVGEGDYRTAAEAADEIERLREENAALKRALERTAEAFILKGANG